MPGGSDWAGTLEKILSRMKTIDFGLIPGRGVFGHPQGPRAGAKSLHQAWEAYLAKTPLEEYARGCPELAAAIETFGASSSAKKTTSDSRDCHSEPKAKNFAVKDEILR